MGEVDPDIMKEKEPPYAFHDSGLLKRAAVRVAGGERLPMPQQVADTPIIWEAEVMSYVYQIRRQQAFIQIEQEAARDAERDAKAKKPKGGGRGKDQGS